MFPKIFGKGILKRYTLILDLSETLVHYVEEEDEEGNVNFRPYLDVF